MHTDDDDGMDLALPFVVVASEGGPYDDASFAAGYQCAEIDGILGQRNVLEFTTPVYSLVLPQVDLIAMRNGYTMSHEPMPSVDGDWSYARFVRQGPPDPHDLPNIWGPLLPRSRPNT